MNKRALFGAAALSVAILIAPSAAAFADTTVKTVPTTATCVPADAWDETIVDVPSQSGKDAIPAIEEVTHEEFQRYSWVGGPLDGAPTSTPPGFGWQANTTNYPGAGHGDDPLGEPFDKGENGRADWFFWTQHTVVDQPYVPEVPAVPAVEEVSHVVHHEAVTCYTPPTNVQCEATAGPVSTNLAPWSNVDTRTSGHFEYEEDALHVWTTDATSQAKVSLGTAASWALKNTGTLDLDWVGSTPPPGINLFVNFGADGNGTLVYEDVYGQDLWLTNGSSAAVKANAPVIGGGNGSEWHGTIDQWLTKYPDAQVTGLAFSLGSGVLGDGRINSITAGCQVYTFDYVEPTPDPEPTTDPEPTVTPVPTPSTTAATVVPGELAATGSEESGFPLAMGALLALLSGAGILIWRKVAAKH